MRSVDVAGSSDAWQVDSTLQMEVMLLRGDLSMSVIAAASGALCKTSRNNSSRAAVGSACDSMNMPTANQYLQVGGVGAGGRGWGCLSKPCYVA